MRAVIYARVSSQDQLQGYSLGSQIKICKEYASKNEYEVRDEDIFIEEGESAKTADRTQLLRLLNHCQKNKGKIDALIVYKLDRLARQMSDHTIIKAKLFASGVVLKSATESLDESPTGKLTEHLLAAIAQFDNDVRAQRTTEGMKERVMGGLYTWPAPLGYENVVINGEHTIQPDKVRGPLIRKAFEEFATGMYSLVQLTQKIGKLGLTSKSGKPVSYQTMSDLLSKKTYMGVISVPEWGLEVDGKFEKIISPSLFFKVQAVRYGKGLTNIPRVKGNPTFPLRGLLKCGRCGKPFTASLSKGRRERYGYYRCYQKGCVLSSHRKEAVEANFVEFLKKIQLHPQVAKLFREVVIEIWKNKHEEKIELADKVDEEITKIKADITLLTQKNLANVIPDEDYKDQLAIMKNKIAVKELERSELKSLEFDLEASLSKADSVLQGLSVIWLDGDLETRQRLQAVVFPKEVFYTKDKFETAELALPFKIIGDFRTDKSGLVARSRHYLNRRRAESYRESLSSTY